MKRFVIAVLSSCFVFGCATSSSANYDVRYATLGAATDTIEHNRAAAKAFHEETSEDAKQQLSAIKVFIDSVPPELTMTNNVVEVKAGEPATLVGSVELFVKWLPPREEAALPVIQKATYAASANLAFCPRDDDRTVSWRWRCYLVKTAPAASPQPTGNQ